MLKNVKQHQGNNEERLQNWRFQKLSSITKNSFYCPSFFINHKRINRTLENEYGAIDCRKSRISLRYFTYSIQRIQKWCSSINTARFLIPINSIHPFLLGDCVSLCDRRA